MYLFGAGTRWDLPRTLFPSSTASFLSYSNSSKQQKPKKKRQHWNDKNANFYLEKLVKFTKKRKLQRDDFLEAFRRFDTNQNGTLERKEIASALKILGYHLTKRELDQLMKQADADDSGSLSYMEFVEVVLQDASRKSIPNTGRSSGANTGESTPQSGRNGTMKRNASGVVFEYKTKIR